MVEHNFLIGKKEFGLDSLERKLKHLFDVYHYEIQASRIRQEKKKTFYSV